MNEEIDFRKPSSSFLRSIDLHTLLPQQEPFVMIGSLVAFDETTTVTETLIRPDNLFVDNGLFCTAGMTENIAQTCAARIGYVNKYILKKGVQIGVIGAVRKLHVSGHPKAGDTIRTTVTVVQELLGMTLANATISLGDETLVTAQIKLAVKEGN
ncbi:MAG: pseudouridylate synthase [Prevotellaceae bacterium]|nr:pseudouridylate synthase [Prevotellaceae bacterium]